MLISNSCVLSLHINSPIHSRFRHSFNNLTSLGLKKSYLKNPGQQIPGSPLARVKNIEYMVARSYTPPITRQPDYGNNLELNDDKNPRQPSIQYVATPTYQSWLNTGDRNFSFQRKFDKQIINLTPESISHGRKLQVPKIVEQTRQKQKKENAKDKSKENLKVENLKEALKKSSTKNPAGDESEKKVDENSPEIRCPLRMAGSLPARLKITEARVSKESKHDSTTSCGGRPKSGAGQKNASMYELRTADKPCKAQTLPAGSKPNVNFNPKRESFLYNRKNPVIQRNSSGTESSTAPPSTVWFV